MSTTTDETLLEDREWVRERVGTLDSRGVAKLIKAKLRERSGKAWSVTCGRGSSFGWIDISGVGGSLTPEAAAELAALLGLATVHRQGESYPSSMAYRRVALARAAFGSDLGFVAKPYWD